MHELRLPILFRGINFYTHSRIMLQYCQSAQNSWWHKVQPLFVWWKVHCNAWEPIKEGEVFHIYTLMRSLGSNISISPSLNEVCAIGLSPPNLMFYYKNRRVQLLVLKLMVAAAATQDNPKQQSSFYEHTKLHKNPVIIF